MPDRWSPKFLLLQIWCTAIRLCEPSMGFRGPQGTKGNLSFCELLLWLSTACMRFLGQDTSVREGKYKKGHIVQVKTFVDTSVRHTSSWHRRLLDGERRDVLAEVRGGGHRAWFKQYVVRHCFNLMMVISKRWGLQWFICPVAEIHQFWNFRTIYGGLGTEQKYGWRTGPPAFVAWFLAAIYCSKTPALDVNRWS
jgi:hypothetical protein